MSLSPSILLIIGIIANANANILQIFQEEPPVPKYGYSPQFLQHTDAGKYSDFLLTLFMVIERISSWTLDIQRVEF